MWAIEELLVSPKGFPEVFHGFPEGGLGIPDTFLHCQETCMGLLKASEHLKPVAQRQEMVISILALLWYF